MDSSQKSKTTTLTHQSITNDQNPGGEWYEKLQSKHDDNLFVNIEANFDDKTVQYTLYAILLLLVEFPDAFDEWKLSAIKGVTFLKKSITELEDEFSKVLSLSKLEVDEDLLSELIE